MKTRDQRVLAALTRPENAPTLEEALACNHTLNLPQLLLRHGLPQTVAFLHRKALGADGNGSDARTYAALLRALQVGLDEATGGVVAPRITGRPATVLQELAALDLTLLIAATEAAIGTASWLREMRQARESIQEARGELGLPEVRA